MTVRIHCPQCNANDDVEKTYDGIKDDYDLAEHIAEWHDEEHHDGVETTQIEHVEHTKKVPADD